MRLHYHEIQSTLKGILLNHGFDEYASEHMSIVFSESTIDGVLSHGINRFPRFISTVINQQVDPKAVPTLEHKFKAVERWNGHLGAGILNASKAMDRAIALALENGIGCVGLNNTNHWMRGGTYGWQAANKGVIGICFTNTKPNMPAWGGATPKLGNNPLVIAVPHAKAPIVLDMSLSQYAYGKLDVYIAEGKELPFPGGFDQSGKLTKDPATILENELALPIGLWKGAGLSLMLDLISMIVSGGEPSLSIGTREEEYGLSQVFIAISIPGSSINEWEQWIMRILEDIKRSDTFDEAIYYPGEKTLIRRADHMAHGVEVDPKVWEKIVSLRQ